MVAITLLLFGLSLLARFYFPCKFGNEIENDYDEMMRDVYSIDWINVDKKKKKNFLIIQENFMKKLILRAGNMLPINIRVFLRILKSAYSFYVVLGQMRN